MTSPIEEISIYCPDLTLTNGVQTRSRYLNTESASGDFPVTDSCERNATVMGEDYVRLIFNLTKRIQFDAFSYIEYAGQTFFLKEAYRPKNNGTFRENGQAVSAYYSYDMKFVSVSNMLTKHTCLRNVQVVGESWNEPEININGTLETLYTMIIGSIEQAAHRIRNNNLYYKHCLLSIVANKDKGRLTQGTDLMTFQFSGTNIADALTTIANGYDETEWYIAEDTAHAFVLHICKCEDTESSVLHLSDEEYTNTGADKNLHPTLSGGLRSCEYAQEWTGIVERIMPFGSDRNMVKNMGTDTNTNMIVSYGKRLRLDPHHQVVWNGKTTPTDDMIANGYTGAYIVHDKDGNNVLLLVDKDGAVANPDTNVTTGIEQVVMYDDVYPQCHFKITKVEEQTKRIDGELQPRYTIEGVAVDEDKYPKSVLANIGMFPIKIMEAETLSVLFESGYLNGREFEITNKTTKDAGVTEYSLRFTIVADGDIAEGTLIPSGNFIPRVGDQFALFNMKMPDEFIDIAKDELAQKAYEDLVELAKTRPEVKCVADERMFAQYDVYLGRRMEVSSEIFVSDAAFVSRVISFSHSLTSPSSVSFSLASAIMQGTLSSMESAIGENVHAIGGLDQRAVNLSRRGWRDTAEMAEMLDSLAAEMMVVGVEKNQFAFTSAILCRNDSDCGTAGSIDHFHHLTIGNGTLQHTQKEWIDQHDGLWIIEPIDQLNTCNLTDESVNTEANRAKPYYLYAFCQADNEYAQLHLLDMDYCAAHNIEGDNQYLLLGILSSEFEDGNTSYRVFNRSNGYTAVVGGTITTEQIQDANRSLIIDFQSNPPRIIARNGAEIIGSIKFKASDTLTAEEQLEALGIVAGEAKDTADGAANAAAQAKATANAAQTAVDNVTNDGIISGGAEKSNLKREWQAIAGENMLGTVDGSFYKAVVQAQTYSVSAAQMRNFFDMLRYAMSFILQNPNADTYISAGIPINSAGTSVVNTRDNFNLLWKNYYDSEIAVLNAVSNKIKAAADAAQATADGLKWSVIKECGDADVSYVSSQNVKDFTHKIYEAIPAGTYKATLTSENPGLAASSSGFSSSSLMILKCGTYATSTSNVLNVVGWGEEFTVTEKADIHVLLCQKTSYSSTKKFSYSGTWNLRGMKVLTLTTQSVSALDYLRAALTDGSTEIAGGLTMTNVLMLKNLQGKVTAGMSGLTQLPTDSSKSENVLLWGGGTYEDAYNAAESAEYYKKGSTTPITTLLKKDGTGKIGIFKISDTQAIVDVPNQGKVVIDASSSNGGIFIKDTYGIDKAVITPKSLSAVAINNKKTISKSNKDNNVSVNVKSYTYRRTILTISSEKGNHSPEFGINVNTRITVGPGQLNQGQFNTILFSIRLYLTNSSGKTEYRTIYSTSKEITYEENKEAYDNQENLIYDFKYSSSGAFSTLSNCVLNYVQLVVEVEGNPNGNDGDYDQPDCSIENVLLNNSISITDDVTLSVNPHTIIANDGILSYYDSTKYFKIQNTSSGQKIYAKGLSTTKGTSGSGELYVSKDFIDAFKALCDELKTSFQDARFVGNNGDHADAIASALDEVKSKLSITSIIANS